MEERGQTFRTNGRIFVNMSREPGAISTRVPQAELELLIQAKPDVYFVTPHYEGWDAVLVRLDAVDEDELAGRLEDSWEHMSRKRPARPRRRS